MEETPGGSLTVSGMMGLRRCSGCLKETPGDPEAEEVQLNTEGVRFGRQTRPPETLCCWARSGGLGGHTGLHLLGWVPAGSGRERQERKH